MGLGGLLHLLQDEAGDFAGGIFLAVAARDPGIAIVAGDDLVGHHAHVLLGQRVVEAAADQALDGEEGVFGIGDALALGRLADQALAVGRERHDRGGGAGAFRIFDDLGGRAFHHRDAGIGGAQVNADYFSHVCFLFTGMES